MSITWTADRLVGVDDEYDRENGSRYDTYLKKNQTGIAASQWDDGLDPVRFAVDVWNIATGPIMVPGYIRVRPDLFAVKIHRDEWDGHLYAEIRLPLPQHSLSGPRLSSEWRDWEPERFQHGVPEEFTRLGEPETSGVTKAILTTTTVLIPGRDWALVTPTALEGATMYEEARRAVALVCDHINREAATVIGALKL
ncbi:MULTISPECIES: hypothetical protein [unclassified Streptomyces]|uniref:hypothetical protein n=1 Tax=unclassified Streptomyces TaxID=2593676 RepID=UPI0033259BB5